MVVTDQGLAIARLITRYLDGEGTTKLGQELGVTPAKVCAWIRYGQLGGEYKARFRYPELEIDEEVPIPGMPEVVPAELIERPRHGLCSTARTTGPTCRNTTSRGSSAAASVARH